MRPRRKTYFTPAVVMPALALAVAALGPATEAGAESPADQAREILGEAGLQGGAIVHIGCGAGQLTAALGAETAFLVQGLDANAENVEAARRYVRSQGTYGRVSIDRWAGGLLPYVDNFANLVVVEQPDGVSTDELMRVLAPGGTALLKQGDGWTSQVKPRPNTLDDWTHYLHDASNNAVAHDSVVGPPRRLQWVGSPRYSRHHDKMSSLSALVSAGGRVFYIFDEGTPASILAPPNWQLIARDAFNGVVLWKRPIERWHTHLWPLKSGPAQLPRRLVADGDRVFVTLSLDGPLMALDALTGKTLKTYAGTKATEEAIFCDGTLFALVNDADEKTDYDGTGRFRQGYGLKFWDESPRKVVAVEADSGKVLWKTESRVLPGTLAADSKRAVFHDGSSVVCLDRSSGKELWRSDPVARSEEIKGYYVPILVLYEEVVLFSGGETAGKQTGSWYESGQDTMTALDAKTGKVLWTAYHPPSGYRSPEDLLVADGLVWTGETTSGRAAGTFTGRDPRTGEVKREFPPDVDTYWFHHRCYRGKATDNYLLMSRTGVEFLDVQGQGWTTNHWVRGACLYGIMPANGLIYAPQHPCACYLEAKLYGFNALAPASSGPRVPAAASQAPRLTKGPAYAVKFPSPASGRGVGGEGGRKQTVVGNEVNVHDNSHRPHPATPSPPSPASGRGKEGPSATGLRAPQDWPTYRGDAARSGRTETAVPKELAMAWESEIGGRLSAPVMADGRLFVVRVDEHEVCALDTQNGDLLWSFTAGGRVDSPPTIYDHLCLFGSADGYVYALRAADGVLAWRFRAAPMDQRLVAFEQIESVWPVHGSVLVQEGVLWCVAGRSMFLDGGLRLLRLDPASGRLISEHVLDDRDPQSEGGLQNYVSWLNMPAGLPDVLSSDGRRVYMRSQPFELDGTRLPLEAMPMGPDADRGAPPATQTAEHAHLFSPTGFLDDTWWHRTYWMYGSRFISGWCGYFRAGKAAPAGKIMVFDDDRVYAFGRKPKFFRWTVPIEHQLFSADKALPPESRSAEALPGEKDYLITHQWAQDLPIFARAMVLADNTLFVAGPADLVDEEQAYKQMANPQVQSRLADQVASLQGKRGAALWAVSVADGAKLAELELATPPVFDGMIAAAGRLYMTTTDGRVVCLGGR